jgi:hypothetical protein
MPTHLPYTARTLAFWEGELHAFAGYRDHYEDGILDVDVTVKLREKEGEISEYTRQLFLSARKFCCLITNYYPSAHAQNTNTDLCITVCLSNLEI